MMQGPHLTAMNLKAFIDRQELEADLIELSVPTPTVEAAAAALGVEPTLIVKSLLFWVGSDPVLVLASGPTLVDRRKLAEYFGVGRKQIKLMSSREVLEISGYPVGAVPPFGHAVEIKTFMDQNILSDPIVYAGGGAENTLMQVPAEEIQKITHATMLDFLSAGGRYEPEGSD